MASPAKNNADVEPINIAAHLKLLGIHFISILYYVLATLCLDI